MGLYIELNKKRKNITQIRLGEKGRVLLEIVRLLFFSGFDIRFNWVFLTKLVPPLPQKSQEI